MGKGEDTKGFILNKASRVFCLKGYSKVTMKDICEATGLSRGGLYRHFSSTKEIFLAQLSLLKKNSEKLLDDAIRSRVPGGVLIESFIREQLREITDRENQITLAVYEFSIYEKDSRDIFKERFEESVRILAKLLEYCVGSGVLDIDSPELVSKSIIYTLDGLKMSMTVHKLPLEEVKKQLDYIKFNTLGLKIY